MIRIAQQLAAQLLRHPTVALAHQLGHISEIAALLPADVGGGGSRPAGRGYRPALDAIAAGLTGRGSPYLLAMDAVGATLPQLRLVA